MKLYDECFNGIAELLRDYDFVKIPVPAETTVKDVGQNQLIFRNDTAFELGGGKLPAVSSMALTDSSELVPGDEIYLCGKDLSALSSDTPFARIALIRVNEAEMGDGSRLYNTVRKIEYTRYHINPEGYMIRISPLSHKEAVRIDKKALAKGLSFSSVGKLFIDAYHKHEQVEAVKLLFVTAENFPYEKLSEIMERSEKITKALDHLMRDVKMDCDTCGLRDVCEEVEQLITDK